MTEKPVRWNFDGISDEEWRVLAETVLRLAAPDIEWTVS